MSPTDTPTAPGHIGPAVRDLRQAIDFYAAAFALQRAREGEFRGIVPHAEGAESGADF
jgi:catechol 2,3-dioxygenase-like lactoylglutathione lyase family enzyme